MHVRFRLPRSCETNLRCSRDASQGGAEEQEACIVQERGGSQANVQREGMLLCMLVQYVCVHGILSMRHVAAVYACAIRVCSWHAQHDEAALHKREGSEAHVQHPTQM